MNRIVRALVPGLLGLGLLAGCGDDEGGNQTQATAGSTAGESPLVRHIPADTPYFAANLQPVPEDVTARMWEAAGPLLNTLQQQLSEGIDDLEAKPQREQKETVLLAVLRELDGRLSPEGLDELGIGGDYYAVYGGDILPAMRVDLSDRTRLLAAIDRVQAEVGDNFERLSAGGVDYYEIRDEDEVSGPALVVGILESQLVVGVLAPGSDAEQQVARDALLGASLPASTALARIREINADYELQPYGTGYLDPATLLEKGLAFYTAIEPEKASEISAACRADYQRLAAAVPELVTGYTRLDTSVIEQRTVLRLADDLIDGVQKIATPMKGLVPVDEGAMYMAFGMDLTNLKAFAQERIAALQAEPLACEDFSQLMASLEESSMQLSQPLPPFIGNIQGLRFLVDDVTLGASGEPTGGKVLAALMMTNPQMMLGMGQAFMPQLAELQLKADGVPQKLSADLVPPQYGEVWVAMMNHGFAAATGDGMADRLPTFLDAPAPESGEAPLLVLSYDMKRMFEMQQGILDSTLNQMAADTDADPAEMAQVRSQIDAAIAQYYELFDRVWVTALTTDRGLEFRSGTTLK